MGFVRFLKERSVLVKIPRWIALLIPLQFLFSGTGGFFNVIFGEMCFLYVMHLVYQRHKKKKVKKYEEK